MADYKYNDGSKTDAWVKKMIPVLVHWAQKSWDKPHYYSDLSKAVGYGSDQIGRFLGCIDDAIKSVGKGIPTLNALVVNKNSGLPSYGFGYVDKDYDNYSNDKKKFVARYANKKAHDYDWDSVLAALHLKPFEVLNEEDFETLRKKIGSKYGSGGESEAHRLLKEHIVKHPEKINISVELRNNETEHSLLSGDRLDVYFETDKDMIAVEVKSRISDEADITRGIFQCVKYKAILDAQQSLRHTNKNVDAILVLEGCLSEEQKRIVEELEIKVFEGFKV